MAGTHYGPGGEKIPNQPQPDFWHLEAFHYKFGRYAAPRDYGVARGLTPLANAIRTWTNRRGGNPPRGLSASQIQRRLNGGGGGGQVASGSSNAGEHDTGAASGGTNLHRIVSFLESKGLHGNAIAGIVGNLEVESSLNPHAYNSGEGAIGIAQWEGGRRTALQRWAAQHGGSESQLDMQLGYLWHELTTNYRNVLHNIQGASSARQAAAYWDVGPGGVNSGTGFENSSGSVTGERMNFASQFAQTHALPESTGGGPTAPMGGPGFASPSHGPGYKGDLAGALGVGPGALQNILNDVPDLQRIVSQAQLGGWSINKFENAVENSRWWRTHSDTARAALVQAANDPAAFQQTLQQTRYEVNSLAQQLGLGKNLTNAEAQAIAHTAVITGQTSNTQWLEDQIGNHSKFGKGVLLKDLTGQVAQSAQQLEQVSANYGLNWTRQYIANSAEQMALGHNTIESHQAQAVAYAKNLYPSFSKAFDSGQTVMDVAQPYMSTASSLLERDPSEFNLHSPLIMRGLQGVTAKSGEAPSAMPQWQFQQMVKNDPRWQYTDNAKQEAATMLTQLGQSWGYNG